MTTQHTPGPWNVTGLYVRERDGGLVASIIDLWHDQKTPKAEKNANAQLIAAAPELLAALQAAVNLLSWGEAFNSDLPDATTSEKNAAKKVDEFKAIIARATATP